MLINEILFFLRQNNLFVETLTKIENSTWALRLIRGTFWVILGTLMSRGLMFVASVLVARILGKIEYGEYSIIRSTTDMFLVFASFGLGITATKYIAEFKITDPACAGRVLSLSTIIATFTGLLVAGNVYYFAPYLASEHLNAPHLKNALQIGSVILFLNTLNGTQTGALSGLEAFKTIAKVNLTSGFLSFPIQIGGAYWYGMEGAIWGLTINTGVNWLLNHFALKRECKRFNMPLRFKGCFQEAPVIWKFSLPAVLSGLMVSPANWICDILLVAQNNGYVYLGIFNAAVSVSLTISAINTTIGSAFLPLCVSQLKANNKKFDYINIISPWFIGIILICPFVFLYELPEMLYGEKFSGEMFRNSLFLVMSYTLIISYNIGIARNFSAAGYLWYSFLGNFFWGISAIFFMYIFKGYGAQGRAFSILSAYILNTVIFVPLYIKLKLYNKKLMLSKWCIFVWLSIIITFSVVYYFDFLMLTRIFIMLLLYVGIFYFFKKLWFQFVI